MLLVDIATTSNLLKKLSSNFKHMNPVYGVCIELSNKKEEHEDGNFCHCAKDFKDFIEVVKVCIPNL